MAVRPDQHRPTGVDAVSLVPVAVGVAQIPALADGIGHERQPWNVDPLRRPPPCVASAAGQQHKAGAEQVDCRDLTRVRRLSDIHRLAMGLPAIGDDRDQRREFAGRQEQEGGRDRVARTDQAD